MGVETNYDKIPVPRLGRGQKWQCQLWKGLPFLEANRRNDVAGENEEKSDGVDSDLSNRLPRRKGERKFL
jgi:hypothetical protein